MGRTTAHSRAALHLAEESRLTLVREAAQTDPKALIAEIDAFDPTTLEHFHFTMYPEDNDPLWYPQDVKPPRADMGWLWQSALLDWWLGIPNPLHDQLAEWSPGFEFDPTQRVFLNLKARQLGVTWIAMALEVWFALMRPGSRCVAYSYNEDEAKKLIQRAWLMYNSLPPILREHVEVITPQRHNEPAEFIRLKHKESGLISSIQALPATQKAGHGDTVTFALMDEAARQDYCKNIFTAILPATARGDARLVLVSTANGVGNVDTEEGNFFHILYATKRERGLGFCFLPWDAEPTRDGVWYEKYAMKLGEVDRNQQYPLNENDAFMLSGALYFDREAMEYYRRRIKRPLLVGQFVQKGIRGFEWAYVKDGAVEIFEKPVPGRRYALGVDSATGRSRDYTAMAMIDLETGTIVATFRAKVGATLSSLQAYALGYYFNKAKIAVERQGGSGEAIITFLRDGINGLPPYPNQYRHVDQTKGNIPISQDYGLPMGPKTRPQVVEGLATWIRTRVSPYFSAGMVDEMGTFVYHDTGTSPRALVGSNDDQVMCHGIAVDMYRRFGNAPARKLKRRKVKR